MKNMARNLIDLVFPDCCPGCGAPFITGETVLCNNCEVDLPLFPPNEQILDRFAGRINLAEARVLMKFYNAGIAQKLLHAIKYRGNIELGEYLGDFFIHHIASDNGLANIDLIIPVPLHKDKQRARGYNQSYVLAKGMARALGVKVSIEALVRVRKSETQTRKSRAERWQNVSGIFKATNTSLLAGKHILLVDDVITTGATLEACGETVIEAGAASLSIAALAAAM